MFNSYISETNRRLYPALNKHIVTEPNDVDNDNETEPSAKKIKIRHLNVINTCIVPEAPKHVRQSDKVSENSTTHLILCLHRVFHYFQILKCVTYIMPTEKNARILY